MLNLFQPVSYKKGAALAVTATAFWKACSFANSILIALYFGTRPDTDVYFYLIMLIGFGVNFLQRMHSAVVIPEAMHAEQETPGEGRKLLNVFLYFYLCLGLLLVAAGIFLPLQAGTALSRFSVATLAQNQWLLGAAFILFATNLWVSYLTNIMEMHKRFAISLLTPLNALVPLAALLLFGKQMGIISMVYGFLGANVIQIACFLWAMRRDLNWNFTPGLGRFHTRLKKNILSNQTLEIIGLANSLIPLYLISGLGHGLVSALNYARQLSDAPTEIITNRLTSVSKIQLSEDASKKDWENLNVHFLRTNRILIFILAPLAVFTFFYSQDIIALFFQRGNFTQVSVQNASAFLRPLILMTLITAPILIQNNVLGAARKIKESFPYLLVSNLIFTVLVVWTVRTWGAFAYPYTQLVCCLIGFGINAVLFAKHFPYAAYARSLKDAARLLAVNIIALVPAAAVSALLGLQSPFWTLLTSGLVFLAALFILVKYSGDLTIFLEASKAKRFFKQLF